MDGDGGTMQVGWSEEPDGGSLAKMVHAHPSWHTPWIVDRQELKLMRAASVDTHLADSEDLGDVSDHLLQSARLFA
jgi:hypothetical protein